FLDPGVSGIGDVDVVSRFVDFDVGRLAQWVGVYGRAGGGPEGQRVGMARGGIGGGRQQREGRDRGEDCREPARPASMTTISHGACYCPCVCSASSRTCRVSSRTPSCISPAEAEAAADLIAVALAGW